MFTETSTASIIGFLHLIVLPVDPTRTPTTLMLAIRPQLITTEPTQPTTRLWDTSNLRRTILSQLALIRT